MSTATEVVARAPSADPPSIEAQNLKGRRGLFFLLSTRKPLIGSAAIASAIAVALGLVPFVCVAKMASAIYATPPRLTEVRDLAFVAAGALLGRYVFASLSTVLAHMAAFRLLHDLRMRIARKLGTVPLSLFARKTSGEVKRTMMDDVNQIESFVAHHFPDGVAAIAVPILTAALLFSVDWRMTLASLAAAPLAFLAMAIAMRGLDAAHKKWFELQDRTNNAVLEYFRGIHVIKTFGLTAKTFGDLSRSIEEGLTWMASFMRTNGRGYGAFAGIIGSSLAVLMPVGGFLFLRGSLSLGDLVLFLVLGPQLLTSLLRLMFAWGNIERIQEGNARIAAILATPDLAAPSRVASIEDSSIAFRDVRFAYAEGKDVLSGVSFEARAGEVTALVGPSGSGKTTIARLVPRLWEPSSGRVEIGRADVRDVPLDTLLAQISVVFQDVFLFHGTVADNLEIAKASASYEEMVAACKVARIHDEIADLPLGYDTPIGERGARLSGGQKQRLSIARAILKDAPILVLDEATAFADAENEALIQEALGELCVGRTVLVIAHRLSTIASADRIVVVERGRVVDQGTHEALLARCPLYRALWRDHEDARDWTFAAEEASC